MGGADNPERRSRRSAFTMIELVTILLIIGVLVGMLLPAVQSAREKARRMSCGNNLAQLGFAFHSYHSAFRAMPAGTISEVLPVENYPNGYHHSWLVRLLPFMGRRASAEQVDWTVSCYDPANWPVAVTLPKILDCPSDYREDFELSKSSYAGVFDGRIRPIDEESRGILVANRFLVRDDVPDGFAYTLLAGDKWISFDSAVDLGWMSGTRATLRTTGFQPLTEKDRLGNLDSEDLSSMRSPRPATTYEPYGKFLGDAEFDPAVDFDDLDEESAGIGMSAWDDEQTEPLITAFPTPPPRDERTTTDGFSSRHIGGVNMLWADGRVGAVHASVDGEVFSQMGIRDDAMPIESIE